MPHLFANAVAGPNDWKVVRHGGRNGDEWRQRFVGTEPMARITR